METYKNDYKKTEDAVLWEIHEIRHQLSKEHEKMTSAEINARARKIYSDFMNRNFSAIPPK